MGKHLVPTQCPEIVKQSAKNVILVNIGNAKLNHGYFEQAKICFEMILEDQVYPLALKGLSTSLCQRSVWDDEDESVMHCHKNVNEVTDSAIGQNDIQNADLAKKFCAIWSL